MHFPALLPTTTLCMVLWKGSPKKSARWEYLGNWFLDGRRLWAPAGASRHDGVGVEKPAKWALSRWRQSKKRELVTLARGRQELGINRLINMPDVGTIPFLETALNLWIELQARVGILVVLASSGREDSRLFWHRHSSGTRQYAFGKKQYLIFHSFFLHLGFSFHQSHRYFPSFFQRQQTNKASKWNKPEFLFSLRKLVFLIFRNQFS